MSFLLGISDFSVGEGIYTPKELLRLCRRLGYRDLVLWDRGLQGYPKLRGELDWAQELERTGQTHPSFQGPGCRASELTLRFGSRFSWQGFDFGAIPLSDKGYAGLCRLLTTQAHAEAEALPASLREEIPPRDCLLLAEDRNGLEHLRRSGFEALLLAHPHRIQEARAALAEGLAVIAPPVLRFCTPAGLELHRLKRAIATQSTLDRAEALWTSTEAALPRATWEARFPACEAAVQRATAAAWEGIRGWEISWGQRWVTAGPLGLEDADLDTLLEARVREGLRRPDRPVDGDLEARLSQELTLIREKRFAAYFLLVQDILSGEARKAGICGRGSGAASLVGYALGLSNVDPVGTKLMFERFLTPQRKDPPDMDIDFAWDERDEVIQRVFERYGRDRVAMVSNHVFFKTRNALRAVGLAHGRPESELKQYSERSRGWDGGLEGLPPEHPWSPILAQARALRGHFHQFSVHPGGIVVTPGPLWEHAAFMPAPAKAGVSVTTWDKEGVENYGLVKIDLLGNRSLAVIRDARQAVGEANIPPDFGRQARQDAETQALLAQGDSIGVFYVESPATRQLQQRVGRGDFETLVIHSSLIRPAAHRWIDHYVKRIRGEESYQAPDPVFGQLLSESYGVLVYQEDVLKVCVGLAGWTYDRADQLRKLLGKPDCEERLPRFETEFFEGCAAQKVRPEVAREAWDMIRSFQGYSFCKPHSASYAQVSFQSAWLKAHHPAAFFASVITNQGGFYPAIAYLGDARRHRLVVRGPDVNASQWPFSGEGEQGLRVGLMQVKGAREAEVRALLTERETRGPFESLAELLHRVALSVPTVEALASAGAFDRWAPDGDRTRLLWQRLGGVPEGVRPRPTDPFDRADLELETLDLTLELHPAALARVRRGGGPQRAQQVTAPGHTLNFWALVVAEKLVRTEGGDTMQFVTLEDETGLCEAVAFPQAFRRRRRPYRTGEVTCVRGRSVQQDGLSVLELQA